MDETTITDVRAIVTAPEGFNLVVVKVETSEPGLYGLGCASFPQRARAVVSAVEDYVRPFVVGRRVGDIEDIWQATHLSSYYRAGPVLNNALSGLDQALWDILGKQAGLPLHRLFGGRTRPAADVYVHVKSDDAAELGDLVEQKMAAGYRYVRCQPASPGRLDMNQPRWDPERYCRQVPRLFESLRERFGPGIGLLHDIHERLAPIKAIQLVQALEPFDLFFVEDPFAPEDHDWLRLLRQRTSAPIASGELYVGPHEYLPVIRERLIDFIRVHVSMIGGLTPARKLAAFAEHHGVRTAWHGPGDMSPVGHAAQLHLELAASNFGIREAHDFGPEAREVFPGIPELRDGAQWPNDRPGIGIDIDERRAAKHPFVDHPYGGGWPEVRHRDGSVARP